MSITPQRYCEEARYIGRMRPVRELFQAGLQRLAARANGAQSAKPQVDSEVVPTRGDEGVSSHHGLSVVT